jgi:hypothetical protein
MIDSRTRTVLAVGAGLLLMVVTAIYFAEPAHALPSFFPGHVGRHSSEYSHHHVKHGIAAFAVGLALFAYAWFVSGPAARRPAPSR